MNYFILDDGYFRLGIVMEQLAGDVHDLSHSEHFLIDSKKLSHFFRRYSDGFRCCHQKMGIFSQRPQTR